MSSSSRKRIATSGVYFTNAVYFPNHKIYSGFTPGMMNYSCISHVFYGFASVAMDGSIFVSSVPFFFPLHSPSIPLSRMSQTQV